ncbi:hypothetical protein [Ruminiclostridium cellobioparum]|uniref:Uncharacterized protein n=1 Tax=Ruminiclostridium cellobioparum subsp. termitidis CT1112 TaxID=1195236 RepID=S0FUX9_RUMCE|nr:hypothetical protein [Ruminiclostridium cellobioparum]EMS72959.1 hypothetical protein CTER_1115 [Ruminiclostridium cellobioparum subsp. termitidis CT1112]
MLSLQTIKDLNEVINNIDNRIESNAGRINPKELEYLTYQKIKIQQLIDDIHHKEDYFKDTRD